MTIGVGGPGGAAPPDTRENLPKKTVRRRPYMTYCVALRLDAGIVSLSDTRTNAGVDNISTVRKTKTWEVPGERSICLMSAGNLATTQAVTAWLDERNKAPDQRDPTILSAPSMFEVARIVGDTLHTEVANRTNGSGSDAFTGTLILAGRIEGSEPRLYLIYPEGNFIEATDDNPFFQIGEAKYGKPILDRLFDPDMAIEEAVKLLMLSMASTVRSNLSVGPPFDLRFLPHDAIRATIDRRITGEDPIYRDLASGWSDALRDAFDALPNPQL